MKSIMLSGSVLDGNKRGKALGFPTANIALTQAIPEGVYISRTTVGGKIHNSLTFIGVAKTFNATDAFAETYILDFDENLYDKEIQIELLKKIRDNQKFENKQALIEQMKKDELLARAYFSTVI